MKMLGWDKDVQMWIQAFTQFLTTPNFDKDDDGDGDAADAAGDADTGGDNMGEGDAEFF